MNKTKSKKSNLRPSGNASGRSSRTARSFTTYFREEDLPKAVSVNLDWLSFMYESNLNEPNPDQPITWINDSIVLEYIKMGTQIFKYSYNIYMDGEIVAMIHTHPKNEKIMAANMAKFEIKNHILYSYNWIETLLTIIKALEITYIRNISRLDIAIDGANHIYKFLNLYARQGKGVAEIARRGKFVKMLGKAGFDAKRLNKKTMMYQAFKVGSTRKSITVYNKTKEIDEHSHKEYIRDCWKKSGLDLNVDNYRVELRLNSEAIRDIKGKVYEVEVAPGVIENYKGPGVSIAQLANPYYLLEIFRSHIDKFFEFVVVDGDTNVTRATRIDLFQFKKLKIELLERAKRAVVTGAYKAKLAIHNAFAIVASKKIQCQHKVDAALQHIDDLVELYNLGRFFEKKKPDWLALYASPF